METVITRRDGANSLQTARTKILWRETLIRREMKKSRTSSLVKLSPTLFKTRLLFVALGDRPLPPIRPQITALAYEIIMQTVRLENRGRRNTLHDRVAQWGSGVKFPSERRRCVFTCARLRDCSRNERSVGFETKGAVALQIFINEVHFFWKNPIEDPLCTKCYESRRIEFLSSVSFEVISGILK